MVVSRRSILAAALLLSSSQAFPVTQRSRQHLIVPVQSSWSSNNNVNAPSDDMIRKDIAAMREEAKERLESLSSQMEDMIKKHEMESQSFLDSSAFEKADLPISTQAVELMDKIVEVKDIPSAQTNTDTKTETFLAPPQHFAESSKLYGTRWKVVIQVGSTRYNAALTEEDEKPLLLHLVVEFSYETLGERDELLQGSANAKVLEIRESWIGASSMTEGRQRPVHIKSTGGWKVLAGQGPKGIDILRFFIDVEEEICHSQETSTLRCPAERIYCTSGFFSMEHHNEAETFKNYLRDELGRLVNQYEDLQLESDMDERLFSLDGVKRAKQMMDLRKQIKAMNKRITQARIRDPEKAMLRLSRKGDVGVTKEGQVCYKDNSKGMSSEYLVLGKLEMASINKPIVDPLSDPNKLRP